MLGQAEKLIPDHDNDKRISSYDVLGVPISVTNLDHAAETIEEWAKDDLGRFVCVRDVASLMTIVDDPDLAPIHSEASMITPDGMPLVAIGRLRGLPVERTCGPDLFDLVIKRSQASGLRHYFYGGKEGVAERLAQVFRENYPGVKIVGCECPPFRTTTPEEDHDTLRRIKDSGADIVWVGISSPKQEVWMRTQYPSLSQTLVGVGAAFDFHAGLVVRAPVWMQRAGLEWMHRLLTEPHRLWRRYLVLAPRFVTRVAVQELFHRERVR
jgi:N-acetylglucosaminyldiphosphoundecaprenol N-acetyl-beta-D-mannosaminyltransferase